MIDDQQFCQSSPDSYFLIWGGGGVREGIDDWHGEDQQSTFCMKRRLPIVDPGCILHEKAITYCQSWGVGPQRILLAHYLHAKHGVATSNV